MYLALRALVRKGDVRSKKVGNQKLYRLATPARSGGPTPHPPGEGTSGQLPPVPPPQTMPVHHELAVGEILVFHIGDWELHNATNRRGRLVREKLHLPK